MTTLAIFNGLAFTVIAGAPALSPSATIRVMRQDSGALATIYSSRAGAAKTNPFQADAYGRFSFFAAGIPEGYRIRVTDAGSPGLEYEFTYQAIGTLAEIDNPITSLGDLIQGGGSATLVRLAMGSDGYHPAPSSAVGLVWTPPALGFNLVGGYLDWSVVGSPTSTLTVSIKTWSGNDPSDTEPVFIPFRSATAGTGSLTYRKINAATSITINSSALLGTVSNIPFRLWCVAFDDSGTIRLALINCLSTSAGSGSGRDVTAIYPLQAWGIDSATLEDNASDSAQVFYSNGASVSAKAYATLGYATWETGLPNAGNWNSNPTRIQVYGPGVPLPGQAVGGPRRNDTGATATGATAIPLDNTIPQITEGDQYMTQAITPTSAANALRITAQGWFSHNAAGFNLIMALFQDAVANALKAINLNSATADGVAARQLNHTMLAATTSSTTFRIRAGSPTGATSAFNGTAGGGQLLGGVANSFLEVQEIMA